MLTALDQIANQNHLQLVKAAVPYLPRNLQRTMAFFIKFQELQNVMRFFHRPRSQLQACSREGEPMDLSQVLSSLRDSCDGPEQQLIDQLSSLLTAFELYSTMAETMTPETFDLFSSLFGGEEKEGKEDPNSHESEFTSQ